uniref:Uncharacterized protein n=1 Tax=Arundo donax TaxID=35708 RepID=A0A0A9AI42_ARUDO
MHTFSGKFIRVIWELLLVNKQLCYNFCLEF